MYMALDHFKESTALEKAGLLYSDWRGTHACVQFTMTSPLFPSQLAHTKILYISCAEHGTPKQIIAMGKSRSFSQYVTTEIVAGSWKWHHCENNLPQKGGGTCAGLHHHNHIEYAAEICTVK